MKYSKLLLPLLVFSSVASTPVSAATADDSSKVAVLNEVMVISESEIGKSYAKAAERKYKSRLDAIQAEGKNLQKMEEALLRDAATMSEDQRQVKQLELRRKAEDLQLKQQKLAAEKRADDMAEHNKLLPKLQKALEAVVKEEKIDVILDRQAVIYAKPGADISRKVIEKLNKMK